MKIKTIINKIFGVFGLNTKQEEQAVILTQVEHKPKNILEGFEKPKSYINREHTTEQLLINAKYKELKTRKLNFCFIPEKQNSINVRSMLEYIYNELPRKPAFDYKGKVRFFLWSKTRKILEKKYRKDILLILENGKPHTDLNGLKQYKEYYVCQLCDESGIYNQKLNHNTECHEVWLFNDKTKTAILTNLMVLCPMCHKTAHLNMSEHNKELFDTLKLRYCYINNLFIKGEEGLEPNVNLFLEDYNFALSERNKRKNRRYDLDISYWFKLFHKSIEEDNKLTYLYINNEDIIFKTDNIEFLEFLESEFKDNKMEG